MASPVLPLEGWPSSSSSFGRDGRLAKRAEPVPPVVGSSEVPKSEAPRPPDTTFGGSGASGEESEEELFSASAVVTAAAASSSWL